MGIDVHGLSFLRYAKKLCNFGKTITIGRQAIDANESVVRTSIATNANYRNERYCEQLLIDYFGSTVVDSIDNSSFEGASIVHDMNQALPPNVQSLYETVIDGGCLEHIYNIPQALKNCSLLCKHGGQIVHILPANNFCGHGFWQFSPELFFSLYSVENGYQDTEVFLADLSDSSRWYKVRPPEGGRRVNVYSSTQIYVLVRTVLGRGAFSHSNVQQSDYVFEWTSGPTNAMNGGKPAERNMIVRFVRQSPRLYSLLYPLYNLYLRKKSISKLCKSNPNLLEIKIASVL